MDLDQKMIVSVFNSLKVLNVRFREPDITDALRNELRPLITKFTTDAIQYISHLRAPGNISSTLLLNDYRQLVKPNRNLPASELKAKILAMQNFVDARFNPNLDNGTSNNLDPVVSTPDPNSSSGA